ncbi:MAG: hypothetical protein HY078_09935 [Elusimicrobia bacterium]|nr:hypothetical protein [Elusimicrobiota bacterium]
MEPTAAPAEQRIIEMESIRVAQAEIRELASHVLQLAGQAPLPPWSSWSTLKDQVIEKCNKFDSSAFELLTLVQSDAIPPAERRRRFLLIDIDYSACRRVLGLGVNTLAGPAAEAAKQGQNTAMLEGLEMVRHRLSGLAFSIVPRAVRNGDAAAQTRPAAAIFTAPEQAPPLQSIPHPVQAAAAPSPEPKPEPAPVPAPQLEPLAEAPKAAPIEPEPTPSPDPKPGELEDVRKLVSGLGAAVQAQQSNLGRVLKAVDQTISLVRAARPASGAPSSAAQAAPSPSAPSLEAKLADLAALGEKLQAALDRANEVVRAAQIPPAPPPPDPKIEALAVAVERLEGAIERLQSQPQPSVDPQADHKIASLAELVAKLEKTLASACTGSDLVQTMKDRQNLQVELESVEGQLTETTAEKEKLRFDLDTLQQDAEMMRSILQEGEAQMIAVGNMENELTSLKREMEFREQSMVEMMVKQDASRMEEIFKLRAEIDRLQQQAKIAEGRASTDGPAAP